MIEVFADVWCPFAYVGLYLVRRRLDAGAPGLALRSRAWPLELVDGAPMDVAKTARNIADLRGQLGVDLFNGFNPDTFPSTTLPALAVIEAAERSDAALGERAAFRLREALFEDGADIGRPDVVAAVAAELGVTVSRRTSRPSSTIGSRDRPAG